MGETSLRSLAAYSRFLADLLHHPLIEHSTLRVWSDSHYTGIAEGEVQFARGLRLRMREELDFESGLITSYGYEVYRGDERLYPTLASTHPHHKHIPPDIKRHRVPAPDMSFSRPNLPAILQEIEELAGSRPEG
jgi:hypothetical protein